MRTPALAATPALLLALVVAGCGGEGPTKGEDEARATPSATPSVTLVDGVDFCTLLDEEQRDELAGVRVEHPASSTGAGTSWSKGSCTWRDSEYADYTTAVFMTGVRGNAWARDIDDELGGPSGRGEAAREVYNELVETEELRAELSDEQACALWTQFATAYYEEPEDDVVVDTFDVGGGDGEYYVAQAKMCRDGVYVELDLESETSIPKDREALLRELIASAWERARDQLAAAAADKSA